MSNPTPLNFRPAGAIAALALANPIFVDVDGNGFTANGDTLGVPLPTGKGPAARDAIED